jgi:CDP-glucose 4,6-dehydratase
MTMAGFWQNKRVLLTGHTGFKGSWATLWLSSMGAHVTGLSLAPEAEPNLFQLADIEKHCTSHIADIRDQATITSIIQKSEPEIVLHMAAQPLVRRSYAGPVETFATNVMGTVHLLEALRHTPSAQTILVVTTDKVYENADTGEAFVETAPLGGHDPYAASKAATEIVVQSYARSFFASDNRKLATARGGNVIGGGDFSQDRLIPDIYRALSKGEQVTLRNPDATRPWQHVLDCLNGYFLYAQALHEQSNLPPALNFGPPPDAAPRPVAQVTSKMLEAFGHETSWKPDSNKNQPHEMARLALDTTLARRTLGWQDYLDADQAIEWTADWYKAFANGENIRQKTQKQIADFEAMLQNKA